VQESTRDLALAKTGLPATNILQNTTFICRRPVSGRVPCRSAGLVEMKPRKCLIGAWRTRALHDCSDWTYVCCIVTVEFRSSVLSRLHVAFSTVTAYNLPVGVADSQGLRSQEITA